MAGSQTKGKLHRSSCYSIYQEKELIGRRVKSSKIKVVWRFALRCDNYMTREVALKHSVLSGKREIRLDHGLVFNAKKVYGGSIGHNFCIHGCQISVIVEDTPRGYNYDLLVNEVPFYRNPTIPNEKLEILRSQVAKENDSRAERVNNNDPRQYPKNHAKAKAKAKKMKSTTLSGESEHVFAETYSSDLSLFSNNSSPQSSEKSDINHTNDRFPDFELPKGLETTATNVEPLEILQPNATVYNPDVLEDSFSSAYSPFLDNAIPSKHYRQSTIEAAHEVDWTEVPQYPGLDWVEESKDEPLKFQPDISTKLIDLVATQEAAAVNSRPTGNVHDPFAYLVNLDDIRLPAPVDYVKERSKLHRVYPAPTPPQAQYYGAT